MVKEMIGTEEVVIKSENVDGDFTEYRITEVTEPQNFGGHCIDDLNEIKFEKQLEIVSNDIKIQFVDIHGNNVINNSSIHEETSKNNNSISNSDITKKTSTLRKSKAQEACSQAKEIVSNVYNYFYKRCEFKGDGVKETSEATKISIRSVYRYAKEGKNPKVIDDHDSEGFCKGAKRSRLRPRKYKKKISKDFEVNDIGILDKKSNT